MPLSQQDRSLSVSTPLGDDVLLLRAMSAAERLSTLFEYELDLISEDLDIQHDQLLGQPVTVRLELPNDEERFFNGIVNSFSHVGFDGAVALYVATLVPWTWFLTRTSDCRIFQEKTVPDIIKEIFREHGYTDFEERLSGDYRQWVYCVQYRETDFNFISRLMEQEGLYYYFTHEDGKHTLILSDSYSAHSAIAGYEEIPYYPPDETAMRERDHISDWSVLQAVQPGAFAHTDYDFTAPKKNLLALRNSPKSHELADLEIYDYPGEYVESGDGETYARVRLEEMHAGYETVQGGGNARGLTTGALFTLTNYRREDQNREYLIVSASYQLQSSAFGSGGTARGPLFQCSLVAMDAQTPYRPPRVTAKPMVQGPQTAVVVGKSGEEIWTDKYGRVKVQFHWDRYGKSDENSSCWVRVSHPWAGKSWGAIAIPRIGQEVIVDFLEGDPDQPIITGRVYNADQMPPWGLPGNMTQSGILSRSSKGGSGDNANAIRMEDKKGSEQLWIHAEKNQDIEVENDETHWVGHDRTKIIDNDEKTLVKHDRTEKVGNNEVITIGNDHTETIQGSMMATVNRTKSENVTLNSSETIGLAKELTIGGLYQVSVGGAHNTTVGGIKSVQVVGYSAELVGGNKKLTVSGNHTVEVDGKQSLGISNDRSVNVNGKSEQTVKGEHVFKAKKIDITAEDELIITVGSAKLVMKKNGAILLDGKNVNTKASSKVNIKASSDIILKGSAIKEN